MNTERRVPNASATSCLWVSLYIFEKWSIVSAQMQKNMTLGFLLVALDVQSICTKNDVKALRESSLGSLYSLFIDLKSSKLSL